MCARLGVCLLHRLFDDLLARGLADQHHLSVMLKACRTSAEQRQLVRRAEEAGVVPDVSTYNMLLGSLLFEGRADGIRRRRSPRHHHC